MVQFLCKRRLMFRDGEKIYICEPKIIETAPDWVKGTAMWKLAEKEEGLLTVIGGKKAAAKAEAEAEKKPARKTAKPKKAEAEAEKAEAAE